jgi:hypothetical protein
MTLQDNAVGRPNERNYQVDCFLLNRQYRYFPTASERNIKIKKDKRKMYEFLHNYA